jgi:hypothetical protein
MRRDDWPWTEAMAARLIPTRHKAAQAGCGKGSGDRHDTQEPGPKTLLPAGTQRCTRDSLTVEASVTFPLSQGAFVQRLSDLTPITCRYYPLSLEEMVYSRNEPATNAVKWGGWSGVGLVRQYRRVESSRLCGLTPVLALGRSGSTEGP